MQFRYRLVLSCLLASGYCSDRTALLSRGLLNWDDLRLISLPLAVIYLPSMATRIVPIVVLGKADFSALASSTVFLLIL